MYVADIVNSCIVSMDYLVSHRCKLDFYAQQLTVEGRRVLLRTVDKKDLTMKVKHTTVIPTKLTMLLP